MSPSPARILVVDDNEPLRENVVEALLLEGFEVDAAADGEQALARLEERPYGVVIVDLMMPGMSGRELVTLLRTDPRRRGLRVILSTGLSRSEVKGTVPADAWLHKPFGVRDLVAALRAVGVEQASRQAG